MLYLLYTLIGLVIILLTNLVVTVLLTLNDLRSHQWEDNGHFINVFKKYFGKNNNIPLHFADWML
ncbi:hypothetical protein [Lactobacillus xylocopicola]|uniref:Uncharacterized protein n=1 Tax=Lactobacillus xylocopicola TaxID=2976676 RepID=A0ABN6SM16_9LACO|nr:hypothetical protein [Lactobacillus xylocopicola]BDR59967.1 hypothetical protein KIM322_02280 [Lactobacillus xylocopicola]